MEVETSWNHHPGQSAQQYWDDIEMSGSTYTVTAWKIHVDVSNKKP